MIAFIKEHTAQLIGTTILLLSLPLVRYINYTLVLKYASMRLMMELRAKMIVKYINILTNMIVCIVLIVLWGADPNDLLVTLSSLFAVIGVAMFAQWSMLSNVTAGIIIFFTVPFKIGDQIRVLDKEYPVEATILDIKAFHTHLTSNEGEDIVIPNSILLQKGIAVINYRDLKSRQIQP